MLLSKLQSPGEKKQKNIEYSGEWLVDMDQVLFVSVSPGWAWINPFPNKPWFLCVCSRSLLKTLWKREKLLVMSNFSFSRNVFYPSGELSAIFIKIGIVVCKLFQFGRV